MIYKLYRDNTQISHASSINLAISNALDDNHSIHPTVVKALIEGVESMQYGNHPEYSIVAEPAFDSRMVQRACESGEGFSSVLNSMEQGLLFSRQ